MLTVYWFHPLVILSYFLYCKDMEIACDEAVISKMSKQEKVAALSKLMIDGILTTEEFTRLVAYYDAKPPDS